MFVKLKEKCMNKKGKIVLKRKVVKDQDKIRIGIEIDHMRKEIMVIDSNIQVEIEIIMDKDNEINHIWLSKVHH